MALGTLELEILNSIWNLQNSDEDMNISVKEVVEDMSKNGLDRAYTTVKTVMDRLSSKDLLARYRVGKKFYYRSVMDKNEMAISAIKELAKNFFDDNLTDMIRFMETNCLDLV